MVHSVIVNHEGKRYEVTFLVNDLRLLAEYKPVRDAMVRKITSTDKRVCACNRAVVILESKPLDT